MRLVIIGGVAAGMSAAARARRRDRSLEIVVLERGDVISYGACGLPYFFEGQVRSLDELVVYTPEYFRKERNIDVRTGAEVTTLLHGRRRVQLANGETIPYDRLVIATGARPGRVPIEGADQPHVFALHTMQHARRLNEFLQQKNPRHAVVIGSGYVGLEVAEALRTRGLSVTVFEASSDVLNRSDAQLTARVKDELKRYHVDLRCETRIASIGADRVEEVPADLVIAGVGLRPNVEFASEAGLELGRTGATRVNERMETNLAGVFAAGDCAETQNLVTRKPTWVPLGTTANKMGRVAGANAAGGRELFQGIVGTSIIRVFDLGVGMTGLSLAQARREGFDAVAKSVEAKEKPGYFKGKTVTVQLVAERSSRRLLGGLVMGGEGVAGRINVIATALTRGMTVDDFAELDLAYAPPYATVWDPLLIAAQQLSGALD